MSKFSLRQINMGYGGFCGIDWKQQSLISVPYDDILKRENGQSAYGTFHNVFVTGGNISLSYTRPTENTYKAPRNMNNAVPILLGPGVANISGSISFDMSHLDIDYFVNKDRLSRNTFFNLILSNGSEHYAVYHNMWNSFNISASAGGLVTCQVSYVSLNGFNEKINPMPNINGITFDGNKYNNDATEFGSPNIFDRALVAYWQSGLDGFVESFSISLSQDVTPVYLNNDLIMPSYLRSGALRLEANIDSCVSWENIVTSYSFSNFTSLDTQSTGDTQGKFSFNIGNKRFVFLNSLLKTQQYSHQGMGDVVKYSYSIQSISINKPSDSSNNLFLIQNVSE